MPTANKDRTTEPNNALKKLSISTPGVNIPASINNNAFITKENNPNVMILTGNVII